MAPSSRVLLLYTCLTAAGAFKSPSGTSGLIASRQNLHNRRRMKTHQPTDVTRRHLQKLFMNSENDDEYEDSLGDWRQFRMNLINSVDAPAASDGVSSIDGIELTTSQSSTTAVSTKKKERPKSVSRRNEEVLMAQNEDLGEEYLKGVWAHESTIAEVGGLVCRMPLEWELNNPSCDLYYRFQVFLDSFVDDNLEASPTEKRYNAAKQFLQQELEDVTSVANENGKIDPADLDKRKIEVLQLYLEQQQEWQNVCLVVEKNDRTGSAKTITINRPMAFKLSESLARLVLLGAFQATKMSEGTAVVEKREQSAKDTQLLLKFLAAFENECGVYVGGPNAMEEPATLIHGIADLPGAREICRGTGIYEGGIEAACDGVLSGKYKPLDFRFFIGYSSYENKELDNEVYMGKYQPVACSRPLVLKQCIQLPKPLWHEVLEFCGGELEEISLLELKKRVDLE